MAVANQTRQGVQTAGERGWRPALLWACFLGSAWTWVIGMFLPVLLVRDFGVWGWVVFAVPNILGAAAMGFVLTGPPASRRVLEVHLPAAVRFSDVTIAYHVFVVGWLYLRLFGPAGVLAPAGVALGVWILGVQRRRWHLGVALAVTLISLAVLAYWLTLPTHLAWLTPAGQPRLPMVELVMFAPAAVVGFALCPYLDLTFHRARQATDGPTGRAAFALGFVGVFGLMITLSLLYADDLATLFTPGVTPALPATALIVLAVHMTLQAGLTVGLHLHEVTRRRGHQGLHRVFGYSIAAGALAWWAWSDPKILEHGLGVGETVYRVFLLFYGLVFPAYVWLCMLPTRRLVSPRARLAAFVVTIIPALPMAYMGFVTGPGWWILLALILLGIARLVVEALPPVSPPSATRV